MTEHFIEMLDATQPAAVPPEVPATLSAMLYKANREWAEIMTALRQGSNSAISSTVLFALLSRFTHELVSDRPLAGRLVQHFEQQLRDRAPPPPGRLIA